MTKWIEKLTGWTGRSPWTEEKLEDVSGLYYLRDDDVGKPMSDAGTLLKEPPTEDELTFCGAWIVFHFAELGEPGEFYTGTSTISNIYYHIWQSEPLTPFMGEHFDIGYNNTGEHTLEHTESIAIDTTENICEVEGFRLVQAMQFTDPSLATFEGEEIFKFEIVQTGHGPTLRNNPDQYSFVILNLEEDAVLKEMDRDHDGINDYDELFVYFTNPFDKDTDNDGATDLEEVSGALHGFDDSGPNDFTDTTLYKRDFSTNPDR